jgi:hypothetical protein
MTTRFAKTIAAAVTVALLGAAPAFAGGQISFGYTPSNPDEAQALGMGMQMYSLFQGLSSSGANVSQHGYGNSAGGSQNGSNNFGLIVQDGNGHNGTISQNGNNNSCGLFQFGNATNAQCMQNGNGQTGITTVFGF